MEVNSFMPITNGIHTLNGTGAAGPSKQYYATPPPTHREPSTPNLGEEDNLQYHPSPVSLHNEQIVNHIYTSGFQHGNYADINLHVLNRQYRLHAIILSRSPYLAHLINTCNTSNLFMPLEDEPLITEEGFAVALGYLYSSVSMSLIRPQNARAVLAAACLLGGMDDLALAAYQVCKESISPETLHEWLPFLETHTSSASGHTLGSAAGSSAGTPVDEHGPGLANGAVGVRPSPTAVLGHYAKRLQDDVFSYLVVTLPGSLQAYASPPQHLDGVNGVNGAHTNGDSGFEALIRIYSVLPFDIFKLAVESPAFPIGNDQVRFRFAKEAIAARKKTPAGREAEETVVLAFGKSDGGSAVHITRKLKRRPLWKVTK